ncbi:hypothetical protein BJY04DRAFT_21160 [Aspergillus karnatakaensis]|uniref:SNUT3/LISCH7 family protein n=1 Tax=Aspergillus karnatakaensis TaxID=1810916 RepID=UPI003CCCA75F
MAEPLSKRARRVDSSAMWEMDDRRTRSPDVHSDYDRNPRRDPPSDDGRRGGPREDRRYRSRSRDRREKRKERSRSRDRRDRDRDRDRWDRDRDGRDTNVRDRSASRDRYTGRRGYPSKGERYHDRSRSPIRNGARDRTPPSRGARGDRRIDRMDSRDRTNGVPEPKSRPRRATEEMDIDQDNADGEEDVEELMRRSMGFSKFRSTKNTKVPGNNAYGVRKEKKTEYRQYMNRQGGFNRPLSPSR